MTTILEQLQDRSNETHFSTPPQVPSERAFREMDTFSQLILERKSRENPAIGAFVKEIRPDILAFYGTSYVDQLQEAQQNVEQLSVRLEQLRERLRLLTQQRYDSQIEQEEVQHSRRKTQTHRKKISRYHKEIDEAYEKLLVQINGLETKLLEWEEQVRQLERIVQQRRI
jgi:septal ring factor EnvC (AmiA/AmiB activator)